MANESIVWADLATGADQQLADFNGITWTSDNGGGAGTGAIEVTATLLDGSDVFAGQGATGINGTNDASQVNTGELVTAGNYDGGVSNSALILRNLEGDNASGAGDTETVSLQLDFATNDPGTYSNGVENLSFWLNDIDTSSWDDQIEILAYDLNGNLMPPGAITFANVGTNVSADNSTSTAVITSNGASITPTDAAGALQINVAGPVSSIVIVYSNLDTGSQLVELSDLTFDTTTVPPCFVTGTRILTENGEVAVEDLVEGDLVVTAGNGLKPIRWIGKRTVPAAGEIAPICIAKGALGNSRDLLVSPAHRMVVSDARVSTLFSEEEVLVPAKALVDGDRIYRKPGGEVTYFHILFDQHEVIFAEGAPTESLFLGEATLSGFPAESKAEVLSLFPELNGRLPLPGEVARPVLNLAEAKLLVN